MKKIPVSISEVMDILSRSENLSEEQKAMLLYAEKFHRLSLKDAKKAIAYFKKNTDLPDDVIVKLVDLVPLSAGELTAILSSYDLTLSEEKINTILDYFKGIV